MADSLKKILRFVARGIRDALVGIVKVYEPERDSSDGEDSSSPRHRKSEQLSTLARRRAEHLRHTEKRQQSEPKVLQRVALCCAWNGGVFWLSIILFNNILMPSVRFFIHLVFGGSPTHSLVWAWIGPMLTWTFSALWILPLFILSKVINSLWFQDIADAAYRRTRGRPQQLPTLGKIVADILFSLLLQALFLVQGTLALFLPISGLGQLISLLHMCLLYSLYAFEYKWFNMGWEVHKRLCYIEANWPYFIGFGLPLAILTSFQSSYIISGCIFSILFPLLIISGNEAASLDEKFDFPLRLFAPVVSISNTVFHHSVIKTQQRAHAVSQSATPTRQVRVQQ